MPYAISTLLAWNIAGTEAQAGHATEIEPAHILLGLCKLCDVSPAHLDECVFHGDIGLRNDFETDLNILRHLFKQLQLCPTPFRRRLRALVNKGGPPPPPRTTIHRNAESRSLFVRAEELAVQQGGKSDPTHAHHLCLALLEISHAPWVDLCHEFNIQENLDRARQAGLFSLLDDFGTQEPPGGPLGTAAPPDPSAAKKASSRSYLDRFGRDLTALAQEGKLEPLIGRRHELAALVRILLKKNKNNPLLIGDPGVGKTCLVEGLASWLTGPDAGADLKDRRVIEISMASLVAGSSFRGQFEERMQGVITEAARAKNVIIFIDEIHMALGAGGVGAEAMDAANILKPALARGDFPCIGATTIKEYRKYIEKDPALERRFESIQLDEPSPGEVLEILHGLRSKFETHHGLRIRDDAIDAAVAMSIRYLPDSRLPDKAIDLIDQACAAARLVGIGLGRTGAIPITEIDKAEVAKVIAERCRLPVEQLTHDEGQRLSFMDQILARRVIGQPEAISAVCEAVRTSRAGLADASRPQGVFLFVGPTGTGKTELAKALAEFLFGSEGALIRIDMSEYMEKHTVSRLIGAPPGYLGHDEEGQLTGQLRRKPYSVVLLDEIEKAHPEILNLFLQVFDAGRLTDSHGKVADARHAIFIMTSNLTANSPGLKPVGFAAGKGKSGQTGDPNSVTDLLQQWFRPEFLNRLTKVVAFRALSPHGLREIARKLLAALIARASEQDITLEVSEDAVMYLCQKGFDLEYGARPLARTIDSLVARPLATLMLSGEITSNDRVRVSVVKDQISLHKIISALETSR